MASIGDVFLRLLLDDSDFEKRVIAQGQRAGDKAGAAMGSGLAAGLSKGATQIGTTLSQVGKGLTSTGRSLSTNLTLPLIAAGGAATHFALDFDTSLRQISGLTDVTGEELDGIREKILAMGPAVGKGPQELVEAFYFIASAGFKADEAMEVLETSAKAAAAGLGETQTIAQVLGGVINAYGRENITAATAADILTEAVSQGTAEASGLASVIGNVVPGAAALGVSFDQVTAAMAGMTLTGVGVEESATSLIQIFSSLQKPTTQAEDALREMGLSSAELRRQLREEGLLATLRTLEERFAGNETAAAAVFGNIRALRGVTALLTLDSEQLNAVFAKVADSTGRMQTAYDETEGPQRELARSMAELEATAIELGTDVLPILVDVLKGVAAGARELAGWWRSLDKDTRKQVVSYLALIAAVGPVLLIVGKLATGLGALFKAVGFLTGAKGIPLLITRMKGMGLASLGAIGAIVAVGVALGQMGADTVRTWGELAKRADELGTSWDELHPKARELADRTGVSIEAAMDQIVTSMELAGSTSHDTADVWDENWSRMAATTRRDGRQITDDAGAIPEGVAAELVDGQYVVGPAAEEMVDPIAEALQKAKEDAAKQATEIVAALVGGLTDDREGFRQQVQDFLDDITSPYSDLTRRLDIEGTLASQALTRGLHSTDSQDRADTATFIQGLLSQYELLAPGALAAGELVNPALQSGISRNLNELLTYLMDTAMPGVTDMFDVADQLDLMGYNAVAAYARGIGRAELISHTATARVQNDARAQLGTSYFGEGVHAVDTYARGIQAGADKQTASRAAANVAKQVRDMLRVYSEPRDPRSPLRGITRWGGGMVQTIADGLARGVSDLNPALARVGQAIADGMNPKKILGGFIEALRDATLLETPDNESSPHRAERLAREVVRLRDLLGIKQTGHGFVGESAGAREERLAQEAIKLRALAKEAGVSLTDAGTSFVDTIRDGFTVIRDDFVRLFPPTPLGGLVPSLIPSGITAGLATNPVINKTWILTIGGVPYPFRKRDDFIKALDDVAGFGRDG